MEGKELTCLVTMAESRTLEKVLSILDNTQHPLHRAVIRQRSVFSFRLLSLTCWPAPPAIRLLITEWSWGVGHRLSHNHSSAIECLCTSFDFNMTDSYYLWKTYEITADHFKPLCPE